MESAEGKKIKIQIQFSFLRMKIMKPSKCWISSDL